MKLLQIILICSRVTIDELSSEWCASLHFATLKIPLLRLQRVSFLSFFLIFFFHASQRRVPGKLDPLATGFEKIIFANLLCLHQNKSQFSVFPNGSRKGSITKTTAMKTAIEKLICFLSDFTFPIIPSWFPKVELLYIGTASIFNVQRRKSVRPATVPRSRASSPVPLACDSHDIPQLERCSQTNEWTLTEWYPPFGKLSQRQTKMQDADNINQ